MRSNKKEVVEKIKAHIVDHVGCNDDENRDYTLQEVKAGFMDWYNASRCHSPNYQEAFTEWSLCLPSEVNYCVYYQDQRIMLASWLDETTEEAAKYSDDAVNNLYFALIYREISKMWN